MGNGSDSQQKCTLSDTKKHSRLMTGREVGSGRQERQSLNPGKFGFSILKQVVLPIDV